MTQRSCKPWTFLAAALLGMAVLAPSAQAQDFFSALFGGFGRPPAPAIRPSFGERERYRPAEPRQRAAVSGQTFCVRTCDGRYFPISGPDNQSRATSCNSLCPAAETKIVYGDSIDDAATEGGKTYSELPNAFRYRNELVAGCTCNGKDQMGLASIKIENDPTLRSGDIVAGDHGLVVASKSDRRSASVNFSPAPDRIKARYRRVPVVARE